MIARPKHLLQNHGQALYTYCHIVLFYLRSFHKIVGGEYFYLEKYLDLVKTDFTWKGKGTWKLMVSRPKHVPQYHGQALYLCCHIVLFYLCSLHKIVDGGYFYLKKYLDPVKTGFTWKKVGSWNLVVARPKHLLQNHGQALYICCYIVSFYLRNLHKKVRCHCS